MEIGDIFIITCRYIQVEVVKGCGRYIPRQPYSNIVYSRIQQRDKVRKGNEIGRGVWAVLGGYKERMIAV